MTHLDNITNFLIYMGISLPLLWFGLYIFLWTTPYNELSLIQEGSEFADPKKFMAAQATAYDLGGKMIGLALVMASAIYHSVSPLNLLIWGLIGVGFQIIIFCIFTVITPIRTRQEIPKGNIAVGVLSAFTSIASSMILAALISY